MCARYTLSKTEKDILKIYPYKLTGPYNPNYNLVLTQEGMAITADDPGIANTGS
jgi:putative SOS response-associated peptidase YedK